MSVRTSTIIHPPPCNRQRTNFVTAAWILICALAVSLTVTGPLQPEIIGTDSGVFRYVAKVILSGGMPYRDTFDHKGPLLYLINVFGFLLDESWGIWLLEFGTFFMTFAFAYKMARNLGCTRMAARLTIFLAVGVTLYYLYLGNCTEEYSLPFLYASFLIFHRYFSGKTIKKWHLIVCGFSFAAVVLLRINIAVLWVVMCVGIAYDCIRKKRAKDIFCFLFWFLLGFCLLTVPILLWLIHNQAFNPFIQDYFLFNLAYASTAYKNSQYSVTSLFLNRILSFSFFFSGLVVLNTGILFYISLIRKKLWDILCVLCMLASLCMMCLSGHQIIKYGLMLIPLLLYSISILLKEVERIPQRDQKVASIITVLFIILALSIDGWTDLGKPLYRKIVHFDGNIRQVARVVQENSSEEDKITFCGNADRVYLFSDRFSVSKYSYQSETLFRIGNIEDEYFSDVEYLRPKIIILPTSFCAYNRMKEIVERDYTLLDIVGQYEVYLLAS